MRLEFYWDDLGDPRVRSPRGRELLGRYLESDLQSDTRHARDIAHAVDRVAAGRLPSFSETGNAHTLTLSPAGAVIESEMDERASCLLPLAELHAAVSRWIAFLEKEKEPAAGPRAER
jgi:uncharacterized protein YacL (UPF0231 family)